MNADAPQITAQKPCLPPYANDQSRSLFTDVLRDVSRSFYLTLRVLPREIRPQIGLAYLLARAADTIADTKIVPREKRLEVLLSLRHQLERAPVASAIAEIQRDLVPLQSLPAEKALLTRLGACFDVFASLPSDDQHRVAEVVITLTRGMEFDLTRFDGESSDRLSALETPEQLDQYTYFVAGCVGPFWTKMCVAHLKQLGHWDVDAMCELGIRFGKGLQLCNVLRDIPRDLRIGRCYLPSSQLRALGLQPSDLLDPGSSGKLRPLYDRYLDQALAHLEAAWEYTMAVPGGLSRLRLACAWPVLIGLKTLARLRQESDILNPDRRIKIARTEVYAILTRTYLSQRSDRALNRYRDKLVQAAK